MKPKEFVSQIDEPRIVAAIAAAEGRSSGEIRVFVSDSKITNALAEAQAQFHKLKMEKTRERNGVLLFFAPQTQQFAIVGDTGIHEKCGQPFWEEISTLLSARFKEGHFTEAVVAAVDKVGEVLARHFPRSPDDQNELPNEIVRD